MRKASIARLLQPGAHALRANWRAFVLIQAFAVAVTILYYQWSSFAWAAGQLAAWKDATGGWLFAAVSTVLAGYGLPWIARRITRTPNLEPGRANLFFQLGFFSMVGLIVEGLYRFQSFLFGSDLNFATLAQKTIFDLGVFTPFFMSPLTLTLFAWKAANFQWRPVWEAWSARFYMDRVVPLLIPNWAFWFPVLFCVYALPLDLQFCLFLLCFSAWSLLLVSISSQLGRAAMATDSGAVIPPTQ